MLDVPKKKNFQGRLKISARASVRPRSRVRRSELTKTAKTETTTKKFGFFASARVAARYLMWRLQVKEEAWSRLRSLEVSQLFVGGLNRWRATKYHFLLA